MGDQVGEGDRDQRVGEARRSFASGGAPRTARHPADARSGRRGRRRRRSSAMKIESVSRQRRGQADADVDEPVEGAFDRRLEGPLLGAVEAGGARSRRSPPRPSRARVAQWVGGRERPAAPSRPSLTPKRRRAGRTSRSRPRRSRPARTTPRPRTAPSSPACRRCRRARRRRRVRRRARRRCPAARSVDDLEPDEGHQADRGRPAAQPLRVGEVRRALSGDRAGTRRRRRGRSPARG